MNNKYTRHLLGESINEATDPLKSVIVAHSKIALKGNEDTIDALFVSLRDGKRPMTDSEIKKLVDDSEYEPKNLASFITNVKKMLNP